jgi:hypothetical protein
MAHAALRVYRQSLAFSSCHRIGICSGLQARVCVAGVRHLSSKMGLPRVYFDMSADAQPVGRIVMEVSRLWMCTFIGAVKNSRIPLWLYSTADGLCRFLSTLSHGWNYVSYMPIIGKFLKTLLTKHITRLIIVLFFVHEGVSVEGKCLQNGDW